MWYIYIVECKDECYYTGITNDLTRRIKEHNTSNSIGSKYTHSKRPVTLVYQESAQSRVEALKREAAIKKLSRSQKQQLITVR